MSLVINDDRHQQPVILIQLGLLPSSPHPTDLLGRPLRPPTKGWGAVAKTFHFCQVLLPSYLLIIIVQPAYFALGFFIKMVVAPSPVPNAQYPVPCLSLL